MIFEYRKFGINVKYKIFEVTITVSIHRALVKYISRQFALMFILFFCLYFTMKKVFK